MTPYFIRIYEYIINIVSNLERIIRRKEFSENDNGWLYYKYLIKHYPTIQNDLQNYNVSELFSKLYEHWKDVIISPLSNPPRF